MPGSSARFHTEGTDKARDNLNRWAAAGAAGPWADEWRDLLDRPVAELAAFLVSTSEDAFRLRQSSPFAGVLPPEERRAVIALFRDSP